MEEFYSKRKSKHYFDSSQRLNTDTGLVPQSYCDQYRELFYVDDREMSPASRMIKKAESQFHMSHEQKERRKERKAQTAR